MVRTQIQLTEDQAKTLKQLAEKEDVSVAELIRRSVDNYIKTHTEMSMAEKKRRALSIVGIFNSGLPDLGVNHDDYLEEVYAGESE
jgi:metal-responsive CopG/Arc/MetJ family transcriptional regulator